jgi:hypothetical protein
MSIMVPREHQSVNINPLNMHNLIQKEINDIDIESFQGLQRVWIPQFSIGRDQRQAMDKNDSINGFKIKVDGEKEPL